jgi:hypothetical protein
LWRDEESKAGFLVEGFPSKWKLWPAAPNSYAPCPDKFRTLHKWVTKSHDHSSSYKMATLI